MLPNGIQKDGTVSEQWQLRRLQWGSLRPVSLRSLWTADDVQNTLSVNIDKCLKPQVKELYKFKLEISR